MKVFTPILLLFVLSSLFFQLNYLSPTSLGEEINSSLPYLNATAFCPDSNGVDSDNDEADDLCDLDDDNDGIPDIVECPNIPIDFSGFTSGSHFPGDPDEIKSTYLNGENLPQLISISAPTSFGGASEVNLSAEAGGELLKLGDENQYIVNSGFEFSLSTPLPSTFYFSTSSFIQSEINFSDNLEIIPINPSSDFLWNVISENFALINQSTGTTLEISGDGSPNFAEFEIEMLGFCEGFLIRFTNLDSSDPIVGSPGNYAQFALSTCQDIDFDGIINKFDLDSDNDGILDVDEAGHGAEDLDHDGRIDGLDYEFDDNGLFNDLETSTESGILNYSIGDSESIPDGRYDVYELDADEDGCFDAVEENIDDPDNDGIAGLNIPVVDGNGLVLSITYENPLIHYWRNPFIGPCLTEICNDGIDNDGDNLIDCFDCEDCKEAINCEDQDHDGVKDFCDLDNDNDGILDTTEGYCTTSIRLIGWSHNKDDPIGLPKGHFKPNFEDQYITSAGDETAGPGTDISLIYSNSIVAGVESASLSESITNEDYLLYTFTTNSGWAEQIEINSISHYNALELQNQDASYNFSILYSTDGFSTSNILIENMHISPIDIHILDVIEVEPMTLQPATNYEFRVYFYNLKGHTEFGWDDFSLGGCQHLDTDDDGVFDFHDLDSDGDGCLDAIEGNGGFSLLDIENDTIPGGVNFSGIPNQVGSLGQGIGTTKDEDQQSDLCDVCNLFYLETVSCNDNDGCTIGDSMKVSMIDDSLCIPCTGSPTDCSTGSSSVVSCDDGNILTINDQKTTLDCDGSTCIPCSGTPVDCSNGTTSIVSCEDNNPCTINDVQTILDLTGSICVPCTGTLIDCSSGASSIQPCDDGNIFTINDQKTVLDCDGSTCIPCSGTPVDCSNGTTSIVSCEDNNPCTVNDVQTILDLTGSICVPCAGTLIDCSSGASSIQPCDDGNIFTINDQETVLDCDGSTCIPCSGTPVDCSNGTTSIVSCEDNNPCTINDVQVLLDKDGTECTPCQGVPMDCLTGPITIVDCDDGDPCTNNDQMTILDCDSSVCTPCLGIRVEIENLQIEDLTICQNESIPIVEIGNIATGATLLWFEVDPLLGGTPVYSGTNNDFFSNIDTSQVGSQTYWVIQRLEDCKSAPVSFQLNIESKLIVDAGADILFDCEAGEAMLNGSVPLDEYEVFWNGPDPTIQNDKIDPIVTIPGIYTIQVFNPENSCIGIDSVTVFSPNEIFAFNDQYDYFEDGIFQINVLENDSLQNHEQFSLTTSNLSGGNILINDENIIFYTPTNLGINRIESFTYEVCVLECPDLCSQAAVTIEISPKSIYIPNVFSPNEDGHNDYFYVSGNPNTIQEIKRFEVYNRWGAQVFSAENIPINQPELGWDGYFKGQKTSQNVYIYFVEIEFSDEKIKIFSGDVSVFY